MSEITLSVIIPAYNEEKRLPKTLRLVHSYLIKQKYRYEILVVDDGSSDRTAQIAKDMQAEIPGLWIVGEKKNRGKGYAVRKGMLESQGTYRVFLDADNSTAIDHVEKLWPEFKKGKEVIIGSRDMKNAKRTVRQTWVREKLGDIFNLMVQTASGLWGIWDTQCGFKGFTANAAQQIFSRTTIHRWAFDVEVLVIAKKLGYQIQEVPVVWVNSAQSKVTLPGMIHMLGEVAEISIKKFAGKYNVR